MPSQTNQRPPFEITETRPTAIVEDFDRFLEAVESPNAYLTPREVLDRRTLHDLDGQMATFRTETHPRTDQRYYLLLNLFQRICMAGRLHRPGKDRGKVRMQPTERLSAFRALPPAGRYLALLEGLWVDCDWDDLIPWHGSGGGGYLGSWAAETMELLAGARPDRPMVPGEKRGADLPWFFGEMAVLVVTLGFFGFVRYLLKRAEDSESCRKGEPLLSGLAVTPVGARFLKVLKKQRPFELWNLPFWGPTPPRFPGERIEPGETVPTEETPFAEAFVPLVSGGREDLVLERPGPPSILNRRVMNEGGI